MKKVLRWLALALGAILACLMLVALAARLSDGPLGPFQGGPLVEGSPVEVPVTDWSFVEAVGQVELQLLNPARSRTTWIVVEQGRAFIPCGLPSFRLWKQWPHQAMEDGRAVVRIEGKLYRVQLHRSEDAALNRRLLERVADKYEVDAAGADDPNGVWFFELGPPLAGYGAADR
jgi:hypothetical protein